MNGHRHGGSGAESGMTLVEIMVAVAIVAIVTAGAVVTFGSMGRVKLRGAAYMVAAGIQRGFSWSATHGEPARLVIDLDEDTLTIEHGEGRLLIDRTKKDGLEDEDEDEGEEKQEGGPYDGSKGGSASGAAGAEFDLGVETLSEQIRMGFHEGEVPRYKPPSFEPITDKRWDGMSLEDGIEFVAVYSLLYAEPQQDGKAYIYFYPDGMGDHAVIQLSSKSGQIYSVEVLSLVGKARIHDFAFVPEPETYEEDGE